MDQLKWSKIAPKYSLEERRKYFSRWELESAILGYCAVHTGPEADNQHSRGCARLVPGCSFIRTDTDWEYATMCGPRFLRKYLGKEVETE
jgi:hypothetical protein